MVAKPLDPAPCGCCHYDILDPAFVGYERLFRDGNLEPSSLVCFFNPQSI